MGIIRNGLVVGALVVAMPSPPEQVAEPTQASAETAGVFAYVTAAAETFADVRGFCARKPDVCTTAGVIAGVMEAKAKYGARIIYEWANEAAVPSGATTLLPAELASADPIATGSTGGKTRALQRQSQSTLRLEDLIPEWRGPAAPRKG